MGMKGFITGSLVTLGVVGLVAALKEADIFDDCDSTCLEDDDGAEEMQLEDGDSVTSESNEEEHGATSGTVNFNAEKLAQTAKEIATKFEELKNIAEGKNAEAMRTQIESLKNSLEKMIEDMGKSDAA